MIFGMKVIGYLLGVIAITIVGIIIQQGFKFAKKEEAKETSEETAKLNS
jgi:hypothetical protein